MPTINRHQRYRIITRLEALREHCLKLASKSVDHLERTDWMKHADALRVAIEDLKTSNEHLMKVQQDKAESKARRHRIHNEPVLK